MSIAEWGTAKIKPKTPSTAFTGSQTRRDLRMIDVIIVNYKSTLHLLRCLESVCRSLGHTSANLCVVDNHSGEDLERVRSTFPDVYLEINDKNMGFSAAVNRGLKKTSSPYVVLLNPDTLVSESFFGLTLGYLKSHADVGIVGPKILDHDGKIQGSARSFPTPLTGLFGRASLLSRMFPNNRFTRGNILANAFDNHGPVEVDWVSGACMVLRRKAVEDVGLMDERFFMYWEDADWCRRMWEKGWKVIYFPKGEVMHHVGVSSGKNPVRSLVEFHKSSYLLFNKHSPTKARVLSPLVASVLLFRLALSIYLNRIGALSKAPKEIPGHRKAALPLHNKKRIKILRIITRLNIGGPAIHVRLLSQGLDGARFSSILVAGRISAEEGSMTYLFEGTKQKPVIIPELCREGTLFHDLIALLKTLRILVHEAPDVVHTHTAKAGFAGRVACLFYRCIFGRRLHTIHTFHGNVFEGYFTKGKSRFFILIERILARFTEVILALSESQREELVRKYHIAPSEKIRTLPLGFDLQPFLQHGEDQVGFRESLGIGEAAFLVGIVGRLAPIKNHKMFLESAKIFLEQFPWIPINFAIVGDGEMRHGLEAYCSQLGISQSVLFCGWIRDIPSVYRSLDVLALTSLNEGTPVSIIEAMASSVLVIATDAGGVSDLLGNDKGPQSRGNFRLCDRGVLCAKNDVMGFSRGLKFLLDLNPKEKQGLKERAREFVVKRFSRERLLRDMESLYLEVVDQD